MTTFDHAFDHVLGVEGKYSDHPMDRGGPTKYGITIGRLTQWRKAPQSAADVKALSLAEAKEIYKSEYWDAMWLDDCRYPILAISIFDQAVNRGVPTVTKQIQSLLNELCDKGLVVDGKFGDKTRNALKHIGSFDPLDFAYEFIKLSQESYAKIVQRNPTQAVFIRGWILRSQRLLDLIWEEAKPLRAHKKTFKNFTPRPW